MLTGKWLQHQEVNVGEAEVVGKGQPLMLWYQLAGKWKWLQHQEVNAEEAEVVGKGQPLMLWYQPDGGGARWVHRSKEQAVLLMYRCGG